MNPLMNNQQFITDSSSFSIPDVKLRLDLSLSLVCIIRLILSLRTSTVSLQTLTSVTETSYTREQQSEALTKARRGNAAE